MNAHELGLLSMSAATCAGWLTALGLTLGLDRWRLWRRGRHLDRLGGTRAAPDLVLLPAGRQVQVRLFHDGRTELRMRAEFPGLPNGAALGTDPGPVCPPAVGLLHLALARERLTQPGFRLTAGDGFVELRSGGPGLPSRARIEGLLARLDRAVAACAEVTDEDGQVAASIRSLLDPDPRVRLAAARGAGSLGRAVLGRLTVDRRVEGEVRVEAARALVARGSPEEVREVLARAARRGPERLARYAVRALGRVDGGASVLSDLLRRDHLHPLAAELAVEGLSGRPGGEAHLLAALPTACPRAQRAILEDLTVHGSPIAYVTLDRILSEGGLGLRLDGALRRAARATGARRLEGQGALSELEPAAGAPIGALSSPVKIPG